MENKENPEVFNVSDVEEDFDDEENDRTYEVSRKDLVVLRADKEEDLPKRKDKKVSKL